MERGRSLVAWALAVGLTTAPAIAVVKTERTVDDLQFRSDVLVLSGDLRSVRDVPSLASHLRLLDLGVAPEHAYVDLRTGRFATLRMGLPIIPGRGLGNRLGWDSFGVSAPRTAQEIEAIAGEAFLGFLERHAKALGLRTEELAGAGKVTAISDDFVKIYLPRVVNGVPVRDSQIHATIKYGNLILFGMDNWADLDRSAGARFSEPDAQAILRRHVGDARYGKSWKNSELIWVPVEEDVAGELGLAYRLAWLLRNDLGVPGGRFEALVDAESGEVLEIQDTFQYVATARRVVGGVYPVSNDQTPPDGVEQAGWPMPFVDVETPLGPVTTDVGGNLPMCVDGNITSALEGPRVRMVDVCGAASLTSAADLDWLSGPNAGATDCTTPGVGGPGNTKSSRTGFHELNMLVTMAQGMLPSNPWVQQQLTANMNIVDTCNAFWDGATVNFFREGGGCNNTGEIAAIFDHEWGHGMDDNDAVPSIGSPGEAIADVYASLRLDTSCIGRGFTNSNCGGYGNACLACTGVRQIDYAQHATPNPAEIGGNGVAINNCPATGSRGPCNREVHCEGMAPAEAIWDLWNRELTSAPYNFSLDKAREIGTQLSFRGGGTLSSWYTCDVTGPDFTGGCGAGRAYTEYLAADDDDGNLGNGTPHWQAIYEAFNLHKVGCSTDSPVNGGCAGAPTGAPTVTATPRFRGVELSWTPVANASAYRVYRTDGVFGCNFGKSLIATVAGTSYADLGLQNGRQYSYQVIPMGIADECFGNVSSCVSATPSPAGGGSSMAVLASAATYDLFGGDGDTFLDNCEQLRISMPVSNSGAVALSNVRILSVESTSHPTSVPVGTFPIVLAPSLAVCGSVDAAVFIQPRELADGDSFEVELEITADELSAPEVVTAVATVATEGDFQATASQTWSFESDAQGWVTEQGTFVRSNSGAGTPGNAGFFFRSSANLPDQCDRVRSPLVRLSPTSTLSLSNHFDIEPFYTAGGVWYDRANVAFRELATGDATPVSPSSGRLYNASGANGTCGTAGQPGWAATATTWAASGWTPADLQTGTLAGLPGHLLVRYGTDPALNPSGFRFDTVNLTNFDMAGPDAQGDTCSAPSDLIFADGFESGDTGEWSATAP